MPAPTSAAQLIASFPGRYIPGKVDKTVTYYFSIGDEKHTMVLTPTACTLTPGKPESADCVVKAEPSVFLDLVVKGKAPGALDIARGRFKTSNPALLLQLKECFRL